jgi:general stress protein 26
MPTPARDHIPLIDTLVRSIRVTALTTQADDGSLHVRPMTTLDEPLQPGSSGSLWFFAPLASLTFIEATRRPVGLFYGDPVARRYAIINGRGRRVDDAGRRARLWRPAFRRWFPQGVDDPMLGLLAIDIEQAEYWTGDDCEASPLLRHSLATGFVGERGQGQWPAAPPASPRTATAI